MPSGSAAARGASPRASEWPRAALPRRGRGASPCAISVRPCRRSLRPHIEIERVEREMERLLRIERRAVIAFPQVIGEDDDLARAGVVRNRLFVDRLARRPLPALHVDLPAMIVL